MNSALLSLTHYFKTLTYLQIFKDNKPPPLKTKKKKRNPEFPLSRENLKTGLAGPTFLNGKTAVPRGILPSFKLPLWSPDRCRQLYAIKGLYHLSFSNSYPASQSPWQPLVIDPSVPVSMAHKQLEPGLTLSSGFILWFYSPFLGDVVAKVSGHKERTGTAALETALTSSQGEVWHWYWYFCILPTGQGSQLTTIQLNTWIPQMNPGKALMSVKSLLWEGAGRLQKYSPSLPGYLTIIFI